MIDFFAFPDEYFLNKPISQKSFLNNSDLNPNERKHINSCLLYASVLYDLVDRKGNELIIVSAEVENLIKNQVKPNYIAKIIARVIPYDIVVTLTLGDNAKIFLFDGRANKKHMDRNVIGSAVESPWFSSSNPEYYMENVITELQGTSLPITSVEQTLNEWKKLLTRPLSEREKMIQQIDKERLIRDAKWLSLCEEKDLTPTYSLLSSEFNDYDIEEQVQFVSQLADCSSILFHTRNITLHIIGYGDYLYEERRRYKEYWICRYLELCEDYMENKFNREMYDCEIQQILQTFFGDEIPDENKIDLVDIDELEECMKPYCFGDL